MNGQSREGRVIITERPDLELLYRLRLNRTMSGIEKVNYSTIEGDPFLYKDFVSGSLTLKTGETLPLYLDRKSVV
jgi:hypothetical protein